MTKKQLRVTTQEEILIRGLRRMGMDPIEVVEKLQERANEQVIRVKPEGAEKTLLEYELTELTDIWNSLILNKTQKL